MKDTSNRNRGVLFAMAATLALAATGCSSDSGSGSDTTAAAATSESTEAPAATTEATTAETEATTAETEAPAPETTQPAADPLGDPNAAAGDPIKIGLFNVEGGSVVSQPALGDAAVAAADYANDYLGGLAGRPIEVVRCADKNDGASATACANQFVEEGVAAVVAAQPAQADLLLPTLVGAGIPYVGVSPVASAEVTTPEPFFFAAGFLGTLSAWAGYAQEQGWKSFAIFLVDTPAAVGAVQSIGSAMFEKAGSGAAGQPDSTGYCRCNIGGSGRSRSES